MSHAALSAIVARASRAVEPPATPTDGGLLTRFVRSRDDQAFSELVRRLGPMVLGVCRRVARDAHLAEDAFQAAFVVLARRAADVRPAEAVRGWLYGVAVRTAQEARVVAARRLAREVPVATLPDRAGEPVEPPDADALRILDEEVGALPEHLRSAVMLCELDGLSRKDAAERLGVPEGTLSSRLAKARKLLADRLRKRGLSLPAVGLTALAHVTVPRRLFAQTSTFATSSTPVPAGVAALTNGVFRTMFFQKLKVAVPLAVIALGALAFAALAGDPPPAPPGVTSFAARRADPKPLTTEPNKILFTRDKRLTVIDPDGKNERAVSKDRDAYYWQGGARLSPDGKQVAVSVRDPMPPDAKRATDTLHVRALDEKEPGTSLGVRCSVFAWSPDGARIAYTEYDFAAGKLGDAHFTVDVKTKKTTPLKVPKGHRIIDWTRDGKHLLTLGSNEQSKVKPDRLYFVSAESGNATELTDDGPLLVWGGRVSPDGGRVLMHRAVNPASDKRADPTPGLEVVEAATKKVTPVTGMELNALVKGYCWSPDGKRIAYLWVRNPNRDLTPKDFQTLETERLVTVCDPDGKNAKTISTEKGTLLAILQVDGIDWR